MLRRKRVLPLGAAQLTGRRTHRLHGFVHVVSEGLDLLAGGVSPLARMPEVLVWRADGQRGCLYPCALDRRHGPRQLPAGVELVGELSVLVARGEGGRRVTVRSRRCAKHAVELGGTHTSGA